MLSHRTNIAYVLTKKYDHFKNNLNKYCQRHRNGLGKHIYIYITHNCFIFLEFKKKRKTKKYQVKFVVTKLIKDLSATINNILIILSNWWHSNRLNYLNNGNYQMTIMESHYKFKTIIKITTKIIFFSCTKIKR